MCVARDDGAEVIGGAGIAALAHHAYVVNGDCLLRYYNEAGKGDHRHRGEKEVRYKFIDPDRLMADFLTDVTRWNHENGRS